MSGCVSVCVCEEDVHETRDKRKERVKRKEKREKLIHTDKQTDGQIDRQTQIIH